MSPLRSIRARLVLGAVVVLVAFLAVAGYVVERAHAEGVRSAHFARLQGTVYLLLAGAELNPEGMLVMPAAFTEPRLTLPGSGLYARISNVNRGEEWRSPSALGVRVPFRGEAEVGEWRYNTIDDETGSWLAVTYAVRWKAGSLEEPLVLSVVEDRKPLDRENAAFVRTLWTWLGGVTVLLLLSQTLLLEWALSPLQRVAGEIRRIEDGEQPEVEGAYPVEIAQLTDNINTLVRQERLRQTRYKEALSYLAHSLKTPLAVLRTSSADPVVAEQVGRMDDIVQHQLARAAAGTGTLFSAALPLAPVVQRIRDSLLKVYADKRLAIDVDCPAELAWRIDEGEAFELLGNLMDNSAKWCRARVAVKAWREGGRELHIRIDDDGPGFPDTQAILKIHVRGDEQVPGHGVGLAVVNDIVASHRGELALSASDSGGGRVDVTLRAS